MRQPVYEAPTFILLRRAQIDLCGYSVDCKGFSHPLSMLLTSAECERWLTWSEFTPLLNYCGVSLRDDQTSFKVSDVVVDTVVFDSRVIDTIKAAIVVV